MIRLLIINKLKLIVEATKTYNFSGADANDAIPLAHLCEYLPYGFSEKSMVFSDLRIAVKRRQFTSATGGSVTRQDLTALIVATPTSGENMQRVRASRIASMIGTNGGFADDKVGHGVQGVWKIDLEKFKSTHFDPSTAIDNSVLATSLESIATGNHGRETVLHREKVDEAGEMNTMLTTLYMGDHPIKDVQQMIVTGHGLASTDNAILLNKGSIGIESGNLHVGGNADVDGTLDVDGNASFGADVGVTGALSAASAAITDALTSGSAQIAGALGVGGTLKVDGATTLNNTLTVSGNHATKLGGSLEVGGATTLKDSLTVADGKNTILGGNLTVKGDAQFDKDVSVSGKINVKNLDVDETFRAGNNSGDYNILADKDKVKILNNNFVVGDPDTKGFSISSTLTKIKNDVINLDSPEVYIGSNAMLSAVDGEGVAVNNDNFIVRDENDTTLFEVNQADKEVRVKGGADFIVKAKGTDGNNGDLIFQVDQDGAYQTTDRDAGVYVRKGVVELERNNDGNEWSSGSSAAGATGYIQLDRIVSNKGLDENAFHDYSGFTKYDEYQVNPAYTSVMHDIKLTTRGGARLSDILPDFINKGIYVLDGTYEEKLNGSSVNWEDSSKSSFPYNVETIKGGGSIASAIKANDCPSGAITNCVATPWLGFIPAPSCPPGYLKVSTLNPIRWAMAEAGKPVKSTRTGAAAKEVQLSHNRDPNAVLYGTGGVAEPWKNAYTFQKSTWLNTSLKALTVDGVSYGWSGIIGFIYSAQDYRDYVVGIGEMSAGSINNSTIIWNLFEVYNQQTVGIANVYCYFERRGASSGFKNDALIDRYDQLTKVRVNYGDKDSAYVERLNDPTLKYNDPW